MNEIRRFQMRLSLWPHLQKYLTLDNVTDNIIKAT